MLGNYEPDSVCKYEFPGDFHYLDRVEPEPIHKLNLRGLRELVGLHVCLHLSDGSRRLGYISARRFCFDQSSNIHILFTLYKILC